MNLIPSIQVKSSPSCGALGSSWGRGADATHIKIPHAPLRFPSLKPGPPANAKVIFSKTLNP